MGKIRPNNSYEPKSKDILKRIDSSIDKGWPYDEHLSRGEYDFILPEFSDSTLDWIEQARPTVGYVHRNFDMSPFWIDIYEDNHPNIMVVAGRQTFKTTFCTDKLAHKATARPRSEVCYVSDNEAHLSAFSKQRMRIETFLQNPELRPFLRHDRANIGEISLVNDSTAYLVTDEGEYGKVEGKSLQLLMLDEAQYQDVQFLAKAMYALFRTHGRFYCLGIGGEAGSEYHKMWQRSDQREWIYADPVWREKLQFDAEGRISNDVDELRKILSGHWKPTKPDNTQYRGYHVPQHIMALTPVTIDDAILKYKINPEFSIEYQRIHSPLTIYTSHCEGDFFRAERRPITPEMVEKCFVPYLDFLSPDEVKELKDIYKNEMYVLLGVDWGSGPSASQTVVSIIIHWRRHDRFQLVHLDPRPQEHQLDQCRYIANLARDYDIDFGVADLGYGQIQVKEIQDGGRDSHDIKYDGLGRKRFVGCRTFGTEIKQNEQFIQTTDEHGTELGRLQIDKTTVIQNLVDLIGTFISHPIRQAEEDWKRPKLMLPYYKDARLKIDKLKEDLCSTTRKDLEEISDVAIDDPRQKAKKEYNHPKDSMMSMIYCFVAAKNWDPSAFAISPVKRRKR